MDGIGLENIMMEGLQVSCLLLRPCLHPSVPASLAIITHQIDVSIRQATIGRLMPGWRWWRPTCSHTPERSPADQTYSRYHCHVTLTIVPSFVSYFTLQYRREGRFIKASQFLHLSTSKLETLGPHLFGLLMRVLDD